MTNEVRNEMPTFDEQPKGAKLESMSSELYGSRYAYTSEYALSRAFSAGYNYSKLEHLLPPLARNLDDDTTIHWDCNSDIEVSLGARQSFADLTQLLDAVQSVLGGEWSSRDRAEYKQRVYELQRNEEYETLIRINVSVGNSEHCRIEREEIGEATIKQYKTTIICDKPVTPATPAATAGTEGEVHD